MKGVDHCPKNYTKLSNMVHCKNVKQQVMAIHADALVQLLTDAKLIEAVLGRGIAK